MRHLGYRFKKKPHGVVELQTKDPLTVLAIPDLHIPFHHPNYLPFLLAVKEEFQPDIVVCLGDEVDMAAISFHDHDPDMMGARDELIVSLQHLGDLYSAFPDALCCTSNHTARPFRVAHKAGLPSQMLKSYKEFLCAPDGWSWHDRIVINDVCYIHGENASGEGAAKKHMRQNRMSTVIGHIHSFGGVVYSESPFNQTFAANAGCLIDPQAMAFRYGNKYANKATLGCVVVKNSRHVHFIPMEDV